MTAVPAPSPARSAVVSRTAATPWARPAPDVAAELGSGTGGLGSADAVRILAEVGPNELPPPERPPLWRRILAQFQDVLVYVLLVSAGLKAILGEWIDFTIILLVAVVNAAVGFIQEGRAESALEGIRQMLSPSAEVLRDGAWATVDAAHVVPGDVVRVRPGSASPPTCGCSRRRTCVWRSPRSRASRSPPRRTRPPSTRRRASATARACCSPGRSSWPARGRGSSSPRARRPSSVGSRGSSPRPTT
ncbi:hypothetical protein GCM10025864_37150 [Luteimicrobium album]|uniref:Cation-transporting P-type ATPase N-terminal domain-containing protein n=1 Tax=Luteimicrobium album TaxID=1054550 RepID=A0ABQ6I5K7_9MICO|nr:hypothetical protein GCM10025864_37150 [Luteimicrobium album]